MASFKDIIPQFTPYVQQTPVEDMVKVGMYKQQLYDQGVQKIQSQIDSIAGLSVMHDADKKYIQSKLDELGNNLKTVAAGDFSNFQLVNSVSGMTSQIIKDENVQNAVSSTMFWKKQNSELEKAASEGKGGVSNKWKFDQETNNWLSSDKPGQKFSYRYERYVDNKKAALEAIKSLHPNLTQADIPYEIDANGRINTAKIADVMKRNKIEGIGEEQIQKAIAATFTPENWRQLQLDGEYEFRGVDTDQLEYIATRNYESLRKTSQSTLDNLESQRKITVDPTKSDQLDQEILYYKGLLGDKKDSGKLYESYLKNLEQVRDNPNAVKGAIYKDGFIKQFGDAFTWKSMTSEIVKNPYVEVDQWRKDFAFKQQVESRQAAESQFNMNMKLKEFEQKEKELELKATEVYGIKTNMDWQPLTNATNTALLSEKYYDDHLKEVNNDVSSAKQKLKEAGYNDKQINEMLANLRDNNPDNNRNIPPTALGLLEGINKDENYMNSLIVKKQKIKEEAYKEFGITKKLQDFEKSNIDKIKPIDVVVNGKRFTFTNQELFDIYATKNRNIPEDTGYTIGSGTGSYGPMYGKKGDPLDQYIRSGNKSQQKFNAFVSELKKSKDYNARSVVANSINQFNSSGFSKIYKEANDRYLEKLGKVSSDFVPQIKAAPMDKDGKLTSPVAGALSAMITSRQLGQYGAEGTNDKTASDFLSGEKLKDTKVFVKQQGSNYELWIKNETDPTNIQKYKVSEQNINSLFGPEYINTKTKEAMRLTVGQGNTNLTKNPLHAPVQKSFGNFPLVKKLNITGDLMGDLSSPDKYVISVNLQKKDGRWQNFTLADVNGRGRVGYDQGINLLNGLTDDQVIKYIKLEYPSYDFSNIKGYSK